MSLSTITRHGPEISDAIVSFDPNTLQRKPVKKSDLLVQFTELGNHEAVRIVRQIPERDGALDPAAVDKILITAHCEMQRMSEEFQHGKRVAELLKPILNALHHHQVRSPIRIVDIGCGTGFVIRWLAANGSLGDDVALMGVDFNVALVNEAQRLATIENLRCKFAVANAFRLDEPATIFISTGILHHFRDQDLSYLLQQHCRPETCAFVHFDFHSSPMAPLGSWLFHAVRMREPLARHDGVLSAVRAHKSRYLLDVTRSAAPEFISAIYGTRLWRLPIPRVFHSLVGIRPEYREAFVNNMGKRIASLGKIE
ncbi:MAG TPA: class I SAM-dependent methyltransferase [Pyrinomonadaceae bacterium]|nr:class I SAM-dependent methyltransferase [Pyrinomonadaceae bacterium]